MLTCLRKRKLDHILRLRICEYAIQAKNHAMHVGEKIRKIRRERGLTLEDVAFAAETDAGNLSRIERGQQICSAETLNRLAVALQVSITDLIDAEMVLDGSSQKKVTGKTSLSGPRKGAVSSALQSRFLSLSPENQSLVLDFMRLLLRRQGAGPE